MLAEQRAQALCARQRIGQQRDALPRTAPAAQRAQQRRKGLLCAARRLQLAAQQLVARRAQRNGFARSRIRARLHFEALQMHGAARGNGFGNFAGSQQQFARLANQALRRGPGGIVRLAGLVGKALHALLCFGGFGENQQCIVRQKIEEALATAGLQQRGDGFCAGGQRAAQQRVEQGVHCGGRHALLFGAGAQRIALRHNQIALQQQLARGRQRGGFQFGLRALTGGVEFAQRFHFAAQQFNAHGKRALRRKHIHNAAAQRKLSALFGKGLPRVARRSQRQRKLVAIQLVTPRHLQRGRAHRRAGGNAPGQRRPRRHQHRRGGMCSARRGEPMQHIHALRHDERLRREAVVGRGIGMRKDAHAAACGLRLPQRGLQIQREAICLLCARSDHQRRARMRLDQLRRNQRLRCAAQSVQPHTAPALRQPRGQPGESGLFHRARLHALSRRRTKAPPGKGAGWRAPPSIAL